MRTLPRGRACFGRRLPRPSPLIAPTKRDPVTQPRTALPPFPAALPSGLLIDGTWRPAADGATIAVTDPATEQPFATVPAATDADVDDALTAAAAGLRVWRGTDAWTRSGVLRRTAEILRAWTDELAGVLTREQGKPLAESRGELLATADQYDWYADEARRIYGRIIDGHSTRNRLMVRREPVGVVAAFSAWNFPALLASRKIAPALAAGCAVIVKPAEEAPLTTLVIVQALIEAGLPAGVVNVVTGDPAAISERLIASDVVRKVSLTGSVPVGRILLRQAAEGITSVSMELGGHAPVLVFPDADVESAAALCVAAKYRNAGQVCASPSRFLVHEDVAARFTAAFVRHTEALRVGPGDDPASQVGPLTNVRRVEDAERLIADAVAHGATVATGGGRDQDRPSGFFFRPTVLTDVPEGAAIMREEPFAPVAPITSFTTLEEALTLANGTPFGLASYVFTTDLTTAFDASDGLDAGMVGVNTLAIATAEAPFGGVKASGFGREGGTEGVEDYTVAKYVNVAL